MWRFLLGTLQLTKSRLPCPWKFVAMHGAGAKQSHPNVVSQLLHCSSRCRCSLNTADAGPLAQVSWLLYGWWVLDGEVMVNSSCLDVSWLVLHAGWYLFFWSKTRFVRFFVRNLGWFIRGWKSSGHQIFGPTTWKFHLQIGTLCYTCCMRENKVKIHLHTFTIYNIWQHQHSIKTALYGSTCYTLRCFMGFWASNYDARSLGLATSTHSFLPHEFHLLAALALLPQNQPTCSNCNGRWKMEWVWERGAYWTIRINYKSNKFWSIESVLDLALIQQFVMANRVRLGDIAQPHLDHQLV